MTTSHRSIHRFAPGVGVMAALLFSAMAGPAFAQHHDTNARAGRQSLSFARHVDTNFTQATAQTAMSNATTVIQTCDGTPNADEDVACQVTMQVAGSVGTFGTTGDGGDVVSSDAEMNGLIGSGVALVKVVTAIMFCSGPAGPGLTIIGCGLVGGNGIVSVNSLPGNMLGVEVTHEFLHNKGHHHRGEGGEGPTTPGAILNPVLSLTSNIINQSESNSLHNGAADNGPIVDPPPVINCPAPLTVECTAPSGALKTNPAIAAFLAAASATHGCEPTPTITNNAPATFAHGLTAVKFTATDPDWLGSSSDCTVNVNVVDTTAPTVTCPSPITVECKTHSGTPASDPAIAAFLAGASASDVCDPSPTLSNNAPATFPDGTTHVTFTATDHDGNPGHCTADVHVVDTTAPTITCPAAITVECTTHSGTPASDPAIAAFLAAATATDVCDPSPVITNDAPAVFPDGTTHVTFTATDHSGNAANCGADVHVVDTRPPVITVALNRCVLWPPNHKLVTIGASVQVTDICDPNPTFVLTSITSNEPVNGLGDGDTAPDIVNATPGTPDVSFQVRSERSGKGTGRDYTIVYTASDFSGNHASQTVHVLVPHDQSAGALCATGFNSQGDGFVPGATDFALVVASEDPAKSEVDISPVTDLLSPEEDAFLKLRQAVFAPDIDPTRLFVGNSAGALTSRGFRVVDVNGDGLLDAVLRFKTADVMNLIAASTPLDGPISLHFQIDAANSYLVSNIFALGPPVSLPPEVGSVPIDHPPAMDKGGSTVGEEPQALAPGPVAARPVAPRATQFAGVKPNPFGASATMAFDLAADQAVRLAVYDLRGARVRVLENGLLSAGRYQVPWDGRDESGHPVAGGIYLVRFEAGQVRMVRKAVLMR